jgi:hypothetical protein
MFLWSPFYSHYRRHLYVPGAASTPLGIFEIAGPIYEDATLPFRIDTDLVLEAMAASLRKRVPIHLASHIVPPNVHLRGVLWKW